MLEIISIHIPKTAGQTFKEILRSVYGEGLLHMNIVDGVFRVIEDEFFLVRSNDIVRFARSYRALHGHFYYSDIETLHKDTGAMLITWLRNPVERVISNYRYAMRKIMIEGVEVKGIKRGMTLMEYASRPTSRNTMSRYLKGGALEDFHFVGIYEYLREDMKHLATLMGWQDVKLPKENSSAIMKEKLPPVTEEEKREIERLNEDDVLLYQEAVELRKRRVKSSRVSSPVRRQHEGTVHPSPPEEFQPVTIFLHIPKTGGMTLYQVLEQNFPAESIWKVPARGEDEFRSLPEERRRRFRCIMGHAWFGIHDSIPNPFFYITMLRDPVERLISQYYHAMRDEGTELHRMIMERKLTLEEFLQSGLDIFYNQQTRLIAGRKGVKMARRKTRQAPPHIRFQHPVLLEEAKQNMRKFFRFVGLVEKYDESLLVLKKEIGLDRIYYFRENVTRRIKEQIPSSLRDEILNINRLDWNYTG
jgi:hypothetical protein